VVLYSGRVSGKADPYCLWSTNIEHVGRQYLTAHLLTTVHNASELPD